MDHGCVIGAIDREARPDDEARQNNSHHVRSAIAEMAPVPDPPAEAVDCVAYLNEAWTPYHVVLASCKRLMAAGFEASP